MRLSEAIRLGAMLHPQCFGLSYEKEAGRIVATCAMGAAEVAGYVTTATMLMAMTTLQCPQCPNVCGILVGVVAHLNDKHRWTREQIADWVATVEPAETTGPHATTNDEGVLSHAHH